MAQYWICPYCGDHLDFGEKCYCFLEKERRQQETQRSLATGQDGQIIFNFEERKSKAV